MPKKTAPSVADVVCKAYVNLLSTEGCDECTADHYFNGYFTALDTYGIAYPKEVLQDVHTRAIWATRQVLWATLQPKGKAKSPQSATLDENVELEKARCIVDKLQYERKPIRRFIAGATAEPEQLHPDPDGKPSAAYYAADRPNSVYDTSEVRGESRQHMKRVRILRVKFDGDIEFLVRSDDDIMMQALRERVCL